MKKYFIYNHREELQGVIYAHTPEEAIEIFKKEDPRGIHYGDNSVAISGGSK